MVGHHLEQAYIYRTQLGPVDAHVRSLGSRAADKLTTAGRRAFVRGDLPAATGLFGRAMATLDDADPARLTLAPDLAEALMERGDFDRANEVLAGVESAGGDPSSEPVVARARLVRLLVDLYAGHEEGWTDRTREEVEHSRPIFEAAEDHAGLATLWRVRWYADIWRATSASSAAVRWRTRTVPSRGPSAWTKRSRVARSSSRRSRATGAPRRWSRAPWRSCWPWPAPRIALGPRKQ